MDLIIAEKPSVATEIAKALGGSVHRGDGYLEVGDTCLSWAYGHLLEYAKPDEYDPKYEQWNIDDLPFFPNEFIIRARSEKDKFGRDLKSSNGSIKLDSGIVKQLNVIGRLLKKATLVINAGDSAREGQLIVDELLTHFNYRGPAKRLWLQEMNLPAIKKALAAMRPNEEKLPLYQAALARQSLDFLIGMNCTRAYTTACKSKGIDMVAHVGRVQTPTICLVVARDLEIETFIAKDYFTLRVGVVHANGPFDATWIPDPESPFLDIEKRVTNKAVVEAVATKVRDKTATVTSYVTSPKSISPPLPFSLGGLQKEAFKLFGLSASKSLEIAQALYEKHKLLSYPRTDYSYLPEGDHAYGQSIIEAAKSNLGERWDFPGTPDFKLFSPAWNDKKIGDHFAIRPTDRRDYDLEQLSPMEKNIYKLVVKQFLAQFYPPFKYDSTTAEITCEEEKFKATGKVEKQDGWKILFRKSGLIKETKDDDQVLPVMAINDDCDIKKATVEAKKTSPPSRFDTASLIEAMEKIHLFVTDEKVKKVLKERGIGTPATRSNIIDFALMREYIQEVTEGKRKYYVSTEKARFLYKIVPAWLRKPDLTAYFEELLMQVERKELSFDVLISRQKLFVDKLINAVKDGSVAAAMPAITMVAAPKRVGKKGTRLKAVGKLGAKTAKKGTKSGKAANGSCPKCGSDLLERKGSSGPFLGCSGYPTCRHTEQVKQAH